MSFLTCKASPHEGQGTLILKLLLYFFYFLKMGYIVSMVQTCLPSTTCHSTMFTLQADFDKLSKAMNSELYIPTSNL